MGSSKAIQGLLMFMAVMAANGWTPAPAQAAEVQVAVIQAPSGLDQDESKCRTLIEETFRDQGLDPSEAKIAEAITALCRSETREVLLISRQEQEPVVTFDLVGSYTDGNVQSGSLTAEGGVAKEWDRFTVNASLKAAVVLEDGTVFHAFSISTNEEYFLNDRWSLFGLAGVGRDTGKAIALTTGEFVGGMFHVFGRESARKLKLSAAVGHRYELPVEGGEYSATNLEGFASNKAMLSYRIKYEDAFVGGALELLAALWFQHVLYGPATEAAPAQVFDVSDYRVYADFKLRFALADFGPARGSGRRRGNLALETGVTYDYYARPLSESPWDLVLQGGLSVRY